MWKFLFTLLSVTTISLLAPVTHVHADEYAVGGPLAGLKLPPLAWGSEGELELHPGSVEQWRGEFFRYVPVRSMFDKQSMVRKWSVDDLPGKRETFAEPEYDLSDHRTRGKTGKFRDAVPVVRWKVQNPIVKLDLGTLDRSMYAVRIIAVVETEQLRRFRKPLYLTLRVNDGVNGEINTYRIRSAYIDNFYSLTELFFNAPTKRAYQAELLIDEGSEVDVLVNHVSLDDVLVGSTWRAIKTRRTLHTENEIEQIRSDANQKQLQKYLKRIPELTPEQRLARDEAIWRWLPPINAQGERIDFNVPVPGIEKWPVDEAMGEWKIVGGETVNLDHAIGWVLRYEPNRQNDFLTNEKLGLKYTVSDLWAGRPLPDPFPLKDDGPGLYRPDPNDPNKGQRFSPIAHGIWRRLRAGIPNSAVDLWIKTGNESIARDAAIMLVRFAYQYPSMYGWASLDSLTCQPGARGKDYAMQQRETIERWTSYARYVNRTQTYDKLFPYIKGNQELADSISRFVPWVKTPDDVIMLLDVYLVQHQAKRSLRYHDYTRPHAMAVYATALYDTSVTDPWMQWLFTKTWVYPLPLAGMPDLMVTGHDRSGAAEMQGSWQYAMGENAAASASPIARYIEEGGNPKFDITDPKRFPKLQATPWWALETVIGGHDFPRMGDVAGPEKIVGWPLRHSSTDRNLRVGWKWTGDARFAWINKHLLGRKNETNSEWAAIESAAKTVARAPWLDLPSRYIPNWVSVLESGHQHDDYRFRRAAYVRTGVGVAHSHYDPLDLQIFAHGLPMTIDDGQRSGYSKPNSRFTRQHNTVEVDGGNSEYGHMADAHPRTLADNPGAPYQNIVAPEPRCRARLMQRQVALIDVDEGSGSKPLTIKQQLPNPQLYAAHDTANSYIFDVFRVDGGDMHSYGFHGPIDDEMTWNAINIKPVAHAKPTLKDIATESGFLSIFTHHPEAKLAGDVPSDGAAQVTWRMSRNTRNGEAAHLGKNYDESAPRKYTRLHLLSGADRALQARVNCHKVNYNFGHFMGRRLGKDLSTAFVALIEPYAGEPFITKRHILPIRGNEDDAQRAVAVEVQTVNGHRDVLFADARPQKTREVNLAGQRIRVAGEFALYSVDDHGLRQATLNGGTLLHTRYVRMKAQARQRTAKITEVDYANKTVVIDQPWPARKKRTTIEVSRDGGATAYTVLSAEPLGDGRTELKMFRGADFYRSARRQFGEGGRRVTGKLFQAAVANGSRRLGFSLSDEDVTWQRPARFVSGNTIQVDGKPLTKDDFGTDGIIRVWEYGPGHDVRHATSVSLRRVDDGVFELTADADVELSLQGRAVKMSTDRQNWSKIKATVRGGWVTVTISAEKACDVPLYLQVSGG